MKAFISHSFEDDARFDDLCLALEQEAIPFWNPSEMRGGASLRDQLRKTIEECDVCIFLATTKSIDSKWCLAELGAFWGSQKPVIIYVADDTLSDADFPKQFQGDLWHRRIREVTRDTKAILENVRTGRTASIRMKQEAVRVGDISVGTLLELLRSNFRDAGIRPPLLETMGRLAIAVSSNRKVAGIENSAELTVLLEPLLQYLIGESIESLKALGLGMWKHGFSLRTSTGKWTGFSVDYAVHAGGDVEVYSGCLLVHLSSGFVDSCAVAGTVAEIGIERPTRYDISQVVAHQGKHSPGNAHSLEQFALDEGD